MALIGAINISMNADATKFASGMASAQKSLSGFAATAARFGAGFGRSFAGLKSFGGNAVNFAGLTNGIARAGTDFARFGVSAARSIGGVITKVGLLATGMAGAAGYGIYKLVSAGSDLVESQNKIRVVFGSASGTVIDESNKMAAAFGQSRNEFLDYAGQFGGLFKGAGFVAGDVANLSNQMVNLARDSASFFNVPIDVALDKLKSGLSGEARPLRDFGVFLDDAAVQAQALAMGMVRVGGELTTNQKIQARLALITKGLADASGDYARTANDVANKTREVSGRIQNLAADMGTALQPVAKAVLGEMATAIQAMSMAWTDNQSAIVAWATGVVGGTGETVKSMGILQYAITSVADAMNTLIGKFQQAQSYATQWAAGQFEPFRLMEAGLKKLGLVKTDTVGAISGDLGRLSKEQAKAGADRLKGAKPSDAINEYFTKAAKANQAIQDSLKISALPGGAGGLGAGGLAGVVNKLPAATAAMKAWTDQEKLAASNLLAGGLGSIAGGIKPRKTTGEFRYASAAAAGSAEAANAVLRSKYGEGRATPETAAKATAKNTSTANGHLARISSAMDKLVGNLQPYEFVGDLG